MFVFHVHCPPSAGLSVSGNRAATCVLFTLLPQPSPWTTHCPHVTSDAQDTSTPVLLTHWNLGQSCRHRIYLRARHWGPNRMMRLILSSSRPRKDVEAPPITTMQREACTHFRGAGGADSGGEQSRVRSASPRRLAALSAVGAADRRRERPPGWGTAQACCLLKPLHSGHCPKQLSQGDL